MTGESTIVDQRATKNSPTPRGLPRRVLRWLVLASIAYVSVCVLFGLFQRRLIYYPSRAAYEATPAERGLPFEDLTLTTHDGVDIAAWYMPHSQAKGTVLFLHGNAGNMAGRIDDAQILHRMGVNVLMIDYRGFGRSKGRPDEQGTYEDAETGWRYLVETLGQSPDAIVIFGRSLGGAIAIELASRQTPAGLVVESTFTNIVDVGRRLFPLLPVRWIVSYKYDSIQKVPSITCPKLHFHGTDDSLITFENGRTLFDAAAEPKQFIETPGGHGEAGFTYSSEYSGQLRTFIESVLSENP